MNRILSFTGFFLVWFVFLLGPVVKSPLGAAGDISLLAAASYFGWSLIRGRPLDKHLAPFCVIGLFLGTWAVMNSIILSPRVLTSLAQPALRPIKATIELLGLYFAVTYLSREHVRTVGPRRAYELLLLAAYLTLVAHAIIIIMQFAYPSFRELTYSMLREFNIRATYKGFRMPGLAGAGGAQLSATQGLGFLIGVHLAFMRRNYIPFLIGNLVLIISFVLTGRTGFVLVAVASLYWVVAMLLRRTEAVPGQGLNIRTSSVVWVVVAGIMAFRFIPPMLQGYKQDPDLARAIDRTFETYINYEKTGRVEDRTIQLLTNMYDVPQRGPQLILGEARNYDNTKSVYASDIGFVRQLWGYGLVGVLLHLVYYVLMGILITAPRVRVAMGRENVLFGMVFLASIFLLNYKESFFFARMSFQVSLVAIMGLYWLTPKEQVLPQPIKA